MFDIRRTSMAVPTSSGAPLTEATKRRVVSRPDDTPKISHHKTEGTDETLEGESGVSQQLNRNRDRRLAKTVVPHKMLSTMQLPRRDSSMLNREPESHPELVVDTEDIPHPHKMSPALHLIAMLTQGRHDDVLKPKLKKHKKKKSKGEKKEGQKHLKDGEKKARTPAVPTRQPSGWRKTINGPLTTSYSAVQTELDHHHHHHDHTSQERQEREKKPAPKGLSFSMTALSNSSSDKAIPLGRPTQLKPEKDLGFTAEGRRKVLRRGESSLAFSNGMRVTIQNQQPQPPKAAQTPQPIKRRVRNEMVHQDLHVSTGESLAGEVELSSMLKETGVLKIRKGEAEFSPLSLIRHSQKAEEAKGHAEKEEKERDKKKEKEKEKLRHSQEGSQLEELETEGLNVVIHKVGFMVPVLKIDEEREKEKEELEKEKEEEGEEKEEAEDTTKVTSPELSVIRRHDTAAALSPTIFYPRLSTIKTRKEIQKEREEQEQRNAAVNPLLRDAEGLRLYNFRDLGDVTDPLKNQHISSHVVLNKNLIYRTACLSRARCQTVDVLRMLAFLRNAVGVKSMIDFRNRGEKQEDPFDELVEKAFPTVHEGAPMEECRRFWIPIMNKQLKIVGMFWHGTKTRTKLHMLRAVTTIGPSVVQTFAEEAMNPMGLLGLNKLMLIHSGAEIAEVLRVCANADNYPICYHCSSGKDRTGLITALIMTLCGVSRKDVVENYHQSEIFLQPVMNLIRRENAEKSLIGFDGTPSEVMEMTLAFIEENWTDVPTYLKSAGFEFFEQQMLVNNLVKYAV